MPHLSVAAPAAYTEAFSILLLYYSYSTLLLSTLLLLLLSSLYSTTPTPLFSSILCFDHCLVFTGLFLGGEAYDAKKRNEVVA
jgi:hypothetical protein